IQLTPYPVSDIGLIKQIKNSSTEHILTIEPADGATIRGAIPKNNEGASILNPGDAISFVLVGENSWELFSRDINKVPHNKQIYLIEGYASSDTQTLKPIWYNGGEWLTLLEGEQGPEEPEGPERDSAYQVWLDNGNTGTEEDFIESLRGPKGDKGEKGEDG